MQLLSSPEARAQRKKREAEQKERLEERLDDGDPSLRRTVFGRIKARRMGGILVRSAEGARFAYTQKPLPKVVGETAMLDEEIITVTDQT